MSKFLTSEDQNSQYMNYKAIKVMLLVYNGNQKVVIYFVLVVQMEKFLYGILSKIKKSLNNK